MKIVTAAGKRSIVLNKTEWQSIGKKAGWIATANDFQGVVGGIMQQIMTLRGQINCPALEEAEIALNKALESCGTQM